MLLHDPKLKWYPSSLGCDFSCKPREMTIVDKWTVYRNADGSGQYGIYRTQNKSENPKYMDLTALEAQAVLYELLKE